MARARNPRARFETRLCGFAISADLLYQIPWSWTEKQYLKEERLGNP
jgi:hypothetical protein